MLARPEGLDADYFIQSQDFDKSWETDIQVTKVQIAGAKATLTVRLGKRPMISPPLNITLQKAAGWKIDGVQPGR